MKSAETQMGLLAGRHYIGGSITSIKLTFETLSGSDWLIPEQIFPFGIFEAKTCCQSRAMQHILDWDTERISTICEHKQMGHITKTEK